MNRIHGIWKSWVLLAFFIYFISIPGICQSPFDEFKKELSENFSKFKEQQKEEFETFRHKANEEFAKFMENKWESAKTKPSEQPPVIPSPDPIIINTDTLKPKPPKPVVISEVTPIPKPEPQPSPIEPIQEIEDENIMPYLRILLYGTEFKIRKPDMSGFEISGTSGKELAKGWTWLSSERTNNLINDCLKQREEKSLCDWAYVVLIQEVAKELKSANHNSSTLLTGFLLSQSGYKIRLAVDSKQLLHVFYSPTGIVYSTPLLLIDGKRFYRLDNNNSRSETYEICNFSFPGEKSLSFEITKPLKLDYSPSPIRRVTAHKYPDVQVEGPVNKNLIDFYNDYPDATITEDPLTKWAVHANTPASREIKESIYPVLRQAVKDKTELEAVNILLHLAQSFKYGYDDEIWGNDRAFFMEESWYYPYSDCEDHAVNFSRLVRDILNLEVALIYYPGHLATAVAFNDPEVKGDYIDYDGKRYIVCDPTIFYSNVGMTMRGMDNSQAVLIPLRPSSMRLE